MLVKILAYFVPFAINFLNGGFFFITAHRFAEAQCPGIVVGGSVTAWGVSYCLTTAVISRIMKLSNAVILILSGGILLSLTSAGFIVFNGLYMQFLWLVCSGVGAALFCAPFQLLAKSIEDSGKNPGAVRATAFYTLTWSLGFASGPLAFARLSGQQGFFITLALALAVTASVIFIAVIRKKRAVETSEKQENISTVPRKFTIGTYTRLAVLGWIVGGFGTITVSQIRAMLPKLGEDLAFSRDHIAYILALASYVQAFTALSLYRSREWMWKRIPAVFMGIAGLCSLLFFACGEYLFNTYSLGICWFYLAAGLYGIYSGTFYFYLVYHSLAHPERSGFFVAGNEIIVGVTSMISPLLGGLLADLCGFTGAAFVFAAVIALLALTAQFVMLIPSKLVEEQ